jgi:hypothetical protein
MKRIGRYILNGLTVLSLLICVATVALWVRSYRFEEAACYRSRSHYLYMASSQRGRLWIEVIHEIGLFDSKSHTDWQSGGWVYSFSRDNDNWPWDRWYSDSDYYVNRRGFAFVNGDRMTPVPPPAQSDLVGTLDAFPATAFALPYWLLLVLASLSPVIKFRQVQRYRCQKNRNQCQSCGYDLRATPDRCPECGTIPAVKA